MLSHNNGRTFHTILSVLNDIGYYVQYRVLHACYLGVPQVRERLIIIAQRKDLKLNFCRPFENGKIIMLKEALLDVPESKGAKCSKRDASVFRLVPEGGNWRNLPESVAKSYLGSLYERIGKEGGSTQVAKCLSWSEPSPTLLCTPHAKMTARIHPQETRPLTVMEYARIQSFPDSFEFKEPIGAQYKQIGNAVPPNLCYHVGRAVIAMLDHKYDGFDVAKTQLSLF